MRTEARDLSAFGEPPLGVRPLAISAASRRALREGLVLVTAEHRLGVSISLPGCDDAVFMSRPGIGLLPAHIVVRARDLKRVVRALRRAQAVAGDAALPLRIDARGARWFCPSLAPIQGGLHSQPAQANIEVSRRSVQACPVPLGASPTARERLAPGGSWLDALSALHAGKPGAPALLRGLVGCGAGTTPAGDDILVGALAYAWATQGGKAPIVTALRAREPEFAALTTSIGASYLRAAIRGEFGGHLIAWVRALPRVSPQRAIALARRVASHGASSGCDTLAGFLAAVEIAGASPQPSGRRRAADRILAAGHS